MLIPARQAGDGVLQARAEIANCRRAFLDVHADQGNQARVNLSGVLKDNARHLFLPSKKEKILSTSTRACRRQRSNWVIGAGVMGIARLWRWPRRSPALRCERQIEPDCLAFFQAEDRGLPSAH